MLYLNEISLFILPVHVLIWYPQVKNKTSISPVAESFNFSFIWVIYHKNTDPA